MRSRMRRSDVEQNSSGFACMLLTTEKVTIVPLLKAQKKTTTTTGNAFNVGEGDVHSL